MQAGPSQRVSCKIPFTCINSVKKNTFLHTSKTAPKHYSVVNMGDDLSFEEELLLQVAGRSRPSAKSQGKKRNRRAVSISEDDGEEFNSDSNDESEDKPSQEKGRRSSGVQNKKSRSVPQEEEQVEAHDFIIIA